MSSFYNKIYEIAAKIPKGYVASYGQIARMAGSPRATRAVGTAMRNAPDNLEIPYHRVVNKKGEMTASDTCEGRKNQRQTLESEGVCFLPNGCIDMEFFTWRED